MVAKSCLRRRPDAAGHQGSRFGGGCRTLRVALFLPPDGRFFHSRCRIKPTFPICRLRSRRLTDSLDSSGNFGIKITALAGRIQGSTESPSKPLPEKGSTRISFPKIADEPFFAHESNLTIMLTAMPTFEPKDRPISADQSAAEGVCLARGAAPTSP